MHFIENSKIGKSSTEYQAFLSLREKCPNTEFFLVRILLYSVQIQESKDHKNSAFGHFSCTPIIRSKRNLQMKRNNKKYALCIVLY